MTPVKTGRCRTFYTELRRDLPWEPQAMERRGFVKGEEAQPKRRGA